MYIFSKKAKPIAVTVEALCPEAFSFTSQIV